jgi:hypothetical protein
MKMFVGEAFLRQQTVITNLIYTKFVVFFRRKAKYFDNYFVTCGKLCYLSFSFRYSDFIVIFLIIICSPFVSGFFIYHNYIEKST